MTDPSNDVVGDVTLQRPVVVTWLAIFFILFGAYAWAAGSGPNEIIGGAIIAISAIVWYRFPNWMPPPEQKTLIEYGSENN